MSKTVKFRDWEFNAEPEQTLAAYEASGAGGAESCSCAYCRNFIAQRRLEIPRELRTLLESVGVDPSKDAEVWEAGSIEDNYSFYGGWWHFIGQVESQGRSAIELSTEPSGRAREWSIEFLPGQRSLKLDRLPESPLVQVEFSVKLPWVLDEKYPG